MPWTAPHSPPLGPPAWELGHEVKLMQPSYVKPCLKTTAAVDAEAVCEAVSPPSMRFVEVKSPEQQSVLVIHRTRMTLMRHRIERSNMIRPLTGLKPRFVAGLERRLDVGAHSLPARFL